MREKTGIKFLFVDIGGVLLTVGWGHVSHNLADKELDLNSEEMEIRHNQILDTYELVAESMGIRSILHTDYKSTLHARNYPRSN